MGSQAPLLERTYEFIFQPRLKYAAVVEGKIIDKKFDQGGTAKDVEIIAKATSALGVLLGIRPLPINISV